MLVLQMKHIFTLLFLFCALNLSAQLKINELMTNNVSAVWDDSYNYSMWVELYNTASYSIAQYSYFLTDDPAQPTKWRLPSRIITSKGYSLLWMERPDRTNHAPFKLNPEGGVLYLYNSSGGNPIDFVQYPQQFRNVSYGRVTDGTGDWSFFEEFSAGASNDNKRKGTVQCSKPDFSLPGGLYPDRITVYITDPEPGDTIYYNLNSNEPTRSSTRYVSGTAITLNSSTVLRARTFRTGKLPGDITTATYLIRQRNFTLPVVSLTSPPAYLHDNTVGIYVTGTNGISGNGSDARQNWNQDWDRPANFELFLPGTGSVLNQEIDISVAGGWSRMNEQKSLHIKPKKKFGNNKFLYPIFNSRPNLHYKDILLRNSGNDFYYSMMRDAMMQSLIMDRMDFEYQAYEPAVLYINGSYYGIQNLRERTNADLIYTTHGLDEDEITIAETWNIPNHPEYKTMIDYIHNNDITHDQTYNQLQSMMDVESYIDYMIAGIYYGNFDWPQNNIKMWKKKEGGKWRWILYDTDFGFNLYESLENFNSLTYVMGINSSRKPDAWASRLIVRLFQNNRFKQQFIDRASIHLSSTFKTDRVNTIIDSLAGNIRTEIAYHKTRWKSYRAFDADLNVMKGFSAVRAGNVLNYVREQFLNNAQIQTISISSNISDANYNFNNQLISDNSIELKSFQNREYSIKANDVKGYRFNHWQADVVTGTQVLIPWDSDWKYWDQSRLPATNWKSSDYNDASWMIGKAQLGYGGKGEKTTIGYGPDVANKNPTAYFRKTIFVQNVASLSLVNIKIFVDDGAVVYLNGVEIGRYNMPQGVISYATYSITFNNGEYADFTVPAGMLNEGYNLLSVEVHQTNATSSDLIFNASVTALTVADSQNTDQLLNGTITAPMKLKAIYEEDPTPDPLDNVRIFINEIVASNSIIRDNQGEKDDYIELYNDGETDVDISGWYITDKQEQLRYWQLPTGSGLSVPAKGFLILWADEQSHQGPDHVNFKLSASGEYLGLHAENKFGLLKTIDEVIFPALAANESYSRVPDGGINWEKQVPTHLASNILTGADPENQLFISVYPTQFTDELTIEGANGKQLQLVDMTGKIILQTAISSDQFTIKPGNINSGIYILKAGELHFRVIKR